MMPAGPETIDAVFVSACVSEGMGCLTPYQSSVCFAWGFWSRGGSLLWSGSIRGGVGRLCVPRSYFLATVVPP